VNMGRWRNLFAVKTGESTNEKEENIARGNSILEVKRVNQNRAKERLTLKERLDAEGKGGRANGGGRVENKNWREDDKVKKERLNP